MGSLGLGLVRSKSPLPHNGDDPTVCYVKHLLRQSHHDRVEFNTTMGKYSKEKLVQVVSSPGFEGKFWSATKQPSPIVRRNDNGPSR